MSFNITGYHCLQFQTRSDRDDGRGGVGLFINSKFTYVKRDDLSVFIPHVIESVFFEIQINERKTIYLFIYVFIKTYLYRVVHNQTILILFYSVAPFLAKSKSRDN